MALLAAFLCRDYEWNKSNSTGPQACVNVACNFQKGIT